MCPLGTVFCCHRGGVCTDAWARHRCLQLYLGPKPVRRRALLFSKGLLLLLFFFFFFNLPGTFGGLNVLKNSFCTHVGIRGHQDAAEAGTRVWHRGSTAPPGTQSENLMYSSHILARIHMKLGTHIDLIELNNFHTACHWLRPTGSWLFRAV